MKLRATPKSGIVVEARPGRTGLPPIALPEVSLRRILVPVDFSGCSRKALHYAIAFAKQFQAELTLLHVLEPPPTQVWVIESVFSGVGDPRELVAEELSAWESEIGEGITSKAVVREGMADEQILQAIEENNIDLVILGTRGRSGLAHLFLGSTAERILRHASCPVLLVREHEHDFITTEGGPGI